MKKAVALLSICMLANPVSQALATTGKHHKKRHHHFNHVYKDEKPVATSAVSKDASSNDDAKKNPWMDNLSGSFALTSNYVFRGVSQSENLAAVQGGLTYTFPIHIYANVWASNVKFASTPNAQIEIDTIMGYHNTYGDNFTYDINFDRYNYPGARNINYNEANSVFNYRFLQFGLSYSANEYATHTGGTYYNGGINYNVPSKYTFGIENINVQALLGHSSLSRAAGNSYNDYNISISKTLRAYTAMLQWVSTNGRQHGSPYDGSTVIATISAAF